MNEEDDIRSRWYAYVYRDPSNLVPFYVGKGTRNRYVKHLTRTDHHPITYKVQKMINEGNNPLIEIHHAIDEAHAFFLEECLISLFGRVDLNTGTLLNLTDGGEGLRNISQETRDKMRAAKLGNTINKGRKSKLKGKTRPPHVGEQISASKIGHIHSTEARLKMSLAHLGKTLSKEHKAKISAALTKGPQHE